MNPPLDEGTRARIESTRWSGGETASHIQAALRALKKLFSENIAQRAREILKEKEAGPPREEALGLLYAKSGLFEDARRVFEGALVGAGGPGSAPGPGMT